eukprot:CAMPEP_0113903666 /NCGR_PEP_ID=MMETSP0780_2-20120614/22704_1 /TAXON_ID=652834 /ORGANISM="Palpitomonas bilix" /LENGTH=35 /DNA_ID=CAMNT_0000896951 /DNA_START=119 /DNA_END=223 /DNA_ORIENTATION=- /assembly_acc=CAM_ASM_000599
MSRQSFLNYGHTTVKDSMTNTTVKVEQKEVVQIAR